MAKKIVRNSKLSNRQLNELIRYFALEVPASRAARELQVHRHAADRIYTHIRQALARDCEKQNPLGKGEHEIDESYFAARKKAAVDPGPQAKAPVSASLKLPG